MVMELKQNNVVELTNEELFAYEGGSVTEITHDILYGISWFAAKLVKGFENYEPDPYSYGSQKAAGL